MTISSRFAVAVHILTLLEARGGEPTTSERIAESVNTNPVVVRRILRMLAAAGLTRSRLGAGGGAYLARPASSITLGEVYRAVEGGELFATHDGASDLCPVARGIGTALREATDAACAAMESALSERTIAGIAERVRQETAAGSGAVRAP